MEVMIQSPSRSTPTMDTFNFSDGTMSSPYLSAPSSPKRFGEYYLSAPASPSRISQLYSELDDYFSSTIEAASTNNNDDNVDADDDDDNNNGFAFYVSRESDKSSRSAEELFDGGKIKPLKPENNELFTSSEGTKQENNRGAPKKETRSGDPLASQTEQRRGRDRDRTTATALSSSNSGRRVTRSHSPYRKSNYTWESDQEQQPRSIKEQESTSTLSSNSGAALSSTSSSSSKGSRRWRLRDLLLFRSASEGRGSSKDPLRKYSAGYKKSGAEEVKASSSFRSSDSSRRKGPVSAHELHYSMKKAESQDMKKRTFLPYKQGILGRLSGFGF